MTVDIDIDPRRLDAFQNAFEQQREAFASAHRGPKCHYVQADTRQHYLHTVTDALPRLGRGR